jgi:site-specific DNA-methyltransferase (adenine-specific)
LGRQGWGSDANPLAYLLTRVKVSPPSLDAFEARIASLKRSVRRLDVSREPAHVRMLFSDETLGQLLWLRKNLDDARVVDVFIKAVVLGMLHANANSDGVPRGFTVAMPNTFSMAPNYVRRYIEANKLQPPSVNVLDAVLTRGRRFLDDRPLGAAGRAWRADAATSQKQLARQPRLIFSSPPYLQVIKYGKMNWIRLWFLGKEPTTVDRHLFTSASLPKYIEFMRRVLQRLAAVVASDGHICLVIGDVRRGTESINLANQVARHSTPSTLRVLGIVDDALPTQHKVSRIWGETRGRATDIDRILVLAAPKAKLSPVPTITW